MDVVSVFGWVSVMSVAESVRVSMGMAVAMWRCGYVAMWLASGADSLHFKQTGQGATIQQGKNRPGEIIEETESRGFLTMERD